MLKIKDWKESDTIDFLQDQETLFWTIYVAISETRIKLNTLNNNKTN